MPDETKGKPHPGRRNVPAYVPFGEVPPEKAAEAFHGKRETLPAKAEAPPATAPTGPMTKAEARSEVDAIKRDGESLRRRVTALHDREGWKALGYPSWTACVESEFADSRRSVFYALSAGRVEAEMQAEVVQNCTDKQAEPLRLADSHLIALQKVPKIRRVEVLTLAANRAGDKPVTAAGIREAWGMIQTAKALGDETPDPPEPARHDIDLSEAADEWDASPQMFADLNRPVLMLAPVPLVDDTQPLPPSMEEAIRDTHEGRVYPWQDGALGAEPGEHLCPTCGGKGTVPANAG